jgi:hypothetical protein
MSWQSAACVTCLVGEPSVETEKAFRLDSAFLHGPPPSPLHALLGGVDMHQYVLSHDNLTWGSIIKAILRYQCTVSSAPFVSMCGNH